MRVKIRKIINIAGYFKFFLLSEIDKEKAANLMLKVLI